MRAGLGVRGRWNGVRCAIYAPGPSPHFGPPFLGRIVIVALFLGTGNGGRRVKKTAKKNRRTVPNRNRFTGSGRPRGTPHQLGCMQHPAVVAGGKSRAHCREQGTAHSSCLKLNLHHMANFCPGVGGLDGPAAAGAD